MQSLVAIISVVVLSQHEMFGASAYNEEQNVERRAVDASSVATEIPILLAAARDDEMARLKEVLPTCLALPADLFRAKVAKPYAGVLFVDGRRK